MALQLLKVCEPQGEGLVATGVGFLEGREEGRNGIGGIYLILDQEWKDKIN
jgi:hypothetical protein